MRSASRSIGKLSTNLSSLPAAGRTNELWFSHGHRPEHPARMGLETRIAALQWGPSYKRATWLQAPLAILSLVCGITVWLIGRGWGWLVAAILVGAVVPFTFLIIMPTNQKLLLP